jgi:hypothetical protein
VADWAGLENRCGGNVTEGSNPSLSAENKGLTAIPAVSPFLLSRAAVWSAVWSIRWECLGWGFWGVWRLWRSLVKLADGVV